MPVFLFTDIEGSTRLWEDHTAEMGAAIARHDALLRDQVHAFGGRITKHTGDGITAAFEAGEPLTCALETQLRFAREDWGAVGELRIRVGLNAGAAEWIAGAEPHAGDYFGPSVNATARVMSAAWGGQILFTPQVLSSAPLPPQATLADLGQHLLKDVSAPQQIYQLVHPDLPRAEFPPPRSLSGHAISQTVGQEGQRLVDLEPEAMAVSLVSATLLPTLLGDRPPYSRALADNVGVLRDLGAGALAGFLDRVAEHLPQAEPDEIRRQLEATLLAQWRVDVTLRTDASRLLRAVQGVDAAMAAAASELRETLAQALADLGSRFSEFHWMLGDLQETLGEVRSRQELQLALQREQLARTEEILRLQRAHPSVSLPAPRPEAAPPPAFLETEEDPYRPPVFVARERELAQLDEHLDRALSGQGRVVFVTGEAGQGKTALVAEFARRAQAAHPDLVVAGGNCNAHTGIGDPYLPFREILGLLTGDVEARWAARSISREGARRLWQALPLTARALVEAGPNLVDTFLPGAALVKRAAASAVGGADWLETLEQLMQRRAEIPSDPSLQQSALFEQYTRVLQELAGQRPLLLVLDDLQWVDGGSTSLLFHLGRRIQGNRVLIVGAYRPAEVALGRLASPHRAGGIEGGRERHPLESVVNEFKRQSGDIEVDLGQAEDREFVEALLDSEPNRLGDTFRETLYRQTRGHPLSTVELLRDMQERGDLVQDGEGRWVEEPALDWEALPVQVEAVIAERMGRLPETARELLRVASVEGETFTAEVVARLLKADEREVVQHLGRLDRDHRLVGAQGIRRLDTAVNGAKGGQRLSLYRFQHILFQRYLYNSLGEGERAYLHEDVGIALEALYGVGVEEIAAIAPQLARHFQEAGIAGKAVAYLSQAGDRARRQYANEEAITYFRRALALLQDTPPDASRQKAATELHERLGDVLQFTDKYDAARTAYENALASTPADDRIGQGRLHRKMGRTWGSTRQPERAMESYDKAETALGQEPAEAAPEWWQEWVDIQLGRTGVHYSQAEVGELTELVEKVQPVVKQHGTPDQRAGLFLRLVLVNNRRDRFIVSEQTLAYSQAYLEAAQELGSLHRIALARFVLGFNLLWRGEFDEAKEQFSTALERMVRMGDIYAQTQCLTYLTIVHRKLGQEEEAMDYALRSLEAATSVQAPVYIGAARANLAWVAWKKANLTEALENGKAALESWQQFRGYPFRWLSLFPLTSMALDQDRIAEAVEYARALLEPAQQALPDTLKTSLEGAIEVWERGEPGEARAYFDRAINLAQEMVYL